MTVFTWVLMHSLKTVLLDQFPNDITSIIWEAFCSLMWNWFLFKDLLAMVHLRKKKPNLQIDMDILTLAFCRLSNAYFIFIFVIFHLRSWIHCEKNVNSWTSSGHLFVFAIFFSFCCISLTATVHDGSNAYFHLCYIFISTNVNWLQMYRCCWCHWAHCRYIVIETNVAESLVSFEMIQQKWNKISLIVDRRASWTLTTSNRSDEDAHRGEKNTHKNSNNNDDVTYGD